MERRGEAVDAQKTCHALQVGQGFGPKSCEELTRRLHDHKGSARHGRHSSMTGRSGNRQGKGTSNQCRNYIFSDRRYTKTSGPCASVDGTAAPRYDKMSLSWASFNALQPS